MSLEKYKRDKIIEAVMDKGYSRHPEHEFKFGWLFNRMIQEANEITILNIEVDKSKADMNGPSLLSQMMVIESHLDRMCRTHEELSLDVDPNFWDNMKRELADISNFVDFMFDRVILSEQVYRMHGGE